MTWFANKNLVRRGSLYTLKRFCPKSDGKFSMATLRFCSQHQQCLVFSNHQAMSHPRETLLNQSFQLSDHNATKSGITTTIIEHQKILFPRNTHREEHRRLMCRSSSSQWVYRPAAGSKVICLLLLWITLEVSAPLFKHTRTGHTLRERWAVSSRAHARSQSEISTTPKMKILLKDYLF